MAPGTTFDPATDLYEEEGIIPAFKRTVSYLYFWANMTYLGYSILLRLVDTNAYDWSVKEINDRYMAANVIHLVSAFMYIWYAGFYPVPVRALPCNSR